jgi:hypothetical protein
MAEVCCKRVRMVLDSSLRGRHVKERRGAAGRARCPVYRPALVGVQPLLFALARLTTSGFRHLRQRRQRRVGAAVHGARNRQSVGRASVLDSVLFACVSDCWQRDCETSSGGACQNYAIRRQQGVCGRLALDIALRLPRPGD